MLLINVSFICSKGKKYTVSRCLTYTDTLYTTDVDDLRVFDNYFFCNSLNSTRSQAKVYAFN